MVVVVCFTCLLRACEGNRTLAALELHLERRNESTVKTQMECFPRFQTLPGVSRRPTIRFAQIFGRQRALPLFVEAQ
ncbi:hypothetical protein BDZ85DRAFT_38633 [Elsinoe ampelina]|uniref:Secreted protein n=1 Tax=Elsinoe ampelina TaxID=302913 RepID=A0A6A6G1M6_9PEZI|nr:hypothetical protein BDZ85DRAFT_38633 [Elsinoe ampelina]